MKKPDGIITVQMSLHDHLQIVAALRRDLRRLQQSAAKRVLTPAQQDAAIALVTAIQRLEEAAD